MRALLAAGALAGLCLTAIPAAPARTLATCSFRGATWSEAGQTGAKYELDTSGVACSFGARYARAFTAKANRKPFFPVAGGPKGWTCNSMNNLPKIWVGACVQGTKRFGWKPEGV